MADKMLPVASTFEAIGGTFYLSKDRAFVGPTTSTVVKLKGAFDVLRDSVLVGRGLLCRATFESVVGLLEWVGYFLSDGVQLCHHAHQCRRHAKKRFGKNARNVPVSPALLEAVGTMLAKVEAKEFRPWVANPMWWHGGVDVAADASTSEGWGAHVGGICASGRWEAETFEAIANSRGKKLDKVRVSISPLELLAQVLLLAMVGLSFGRPGNGQIVMRCDNQAAVDVVESRRPKSAAMRVALRKLEELERLFQIRVKLEFIGTKENKLADALSRGAEEEVCEVLSQRGLELQEFDGDSVLCGVAFTEFALQAEREVRRALKREDLELVDGR
jgi:hypothetical protein